jgi:hypothetical protein
MGNSMRKGDVTSTQIFRLFRSTLHSRIEINAGCDTKRVSSVRHTRTHMQYLPGSPLK